MTIKQMEWLRDNGLPLDNVIVYYSGQRLNHEYLGLPDYRYLRVRFDNSPVPESGLKCISALELFKRLPRKIMKAEKVLKETDEGFMTFYETKEKGPLVIDNEPLISTGKDIRDVIFNLGKRLKEIGVWLN